MNTIDAAMLLLTMLFLILFTLMLFNKKFTDTLFGKKQKIHASTPEAKELIKKVDFFSLEERLILCRQIIGSDAIIVLHIDELNRIGILNIGLNMPGGHKSE